MVEADQAVAGVIEAYQSIEIEYNDDMKWTKGDGKKGNLFAQPLFPSF